MGLTASRVAFQHTHKHRKMGIYFPGIWKDTV